MTVHSIDQLTRYELLMLDRGSEACGRLLLKASLDSRRAIGLSQDPVVDVAAGVAGPALAGFVLWLAERVKQLNLSRLAFLSRDGRLPFLMAQRIFPRLGLDTELAYAMSSRQTWSLAGTDPNNLAEEAWVFDSYVASNAEEVCLRLGLDPASELPAMQRVGVNPAPDCRADDPRQRQALERYLSTSRVIEQVTLIVEKARNLFGTYVRQERLSGTDVALVDMGWTGRMVDRALTVMKEYDLDLPHVLFWGREYRPVSYLADDRISAYFYDTRRDDALWLPGLPFLMETFAMTDESITSSYTSDADGRVRAKARPRNTDQLQAWGYERYVATLMTFAEQIELRETQGLRSLVHALIQRFWMDPTLDEARVWGAYMYESDPTGTSALRLASPLGGPWRAGSERLAELSATDGPIR